jgi:hypothetical protein
MMFVATLKVVEIAAVDKPGAAAGMMATIPKACEQTVVRQLNTTVSGNSAHQ